MTSALDGITVLDLTSGPAGALATMFLCDHGARVIRIVDVQDTTPRRGGYLVWDRGKACVQLDLSRITLPTSPGTTSATVEPTASYLRLLRSADVLVEDFAPSSSHQAIVPFDRLSALNPRLVLCSITAYGKHGHLKDEPPIDDLVLARMGILATQPGFRPAPVHVVHPLPSVGAALFAAQGIAASLLAREKTGLGRYVETSLMAGALLYHPKVTGEKLAPNTFQTHPSGSAPFYSVYECADGNWVQLGCVHRGFVATAATVMDIKYVLDEPRFGGGRIPPTEEAEMELRTIVAQAIHIRPYAEWARIFETADVPFAQARHTEEGIDDPQVEANAMVVELQDPEVGSMTQMGVPVRLSHTPGVVPGPRQLASTQGDDVLAGLSEVSVSFDSAARPAAPFDPPLKGIRVLEITNLIAGPTAGRLLADLGADVIKMEPLEGDLSRPIGRTYFFNLNTNKRSLSVNTRLPEGKDVAQKVAATADVLLANLRPGATERMGLGPGVNPRLIETHVTGYGATGPYARRPGIDPLAQALMGLERAQGGPENPPSFPAQLAPTDFTAGALGALGTILALFVRQRTGVVQRVDTNLLNGGIVLSSEWFTRYQGKPRRPLADKGQYGLNPFHRLYQVNDGWLYVVADSPEARRAFARALDCEALLHDPDQVPAGQHPNDTPLAQALVRLFAGLRIQESLERLRSAGVPCAPVMDGQSEIFLDDPHAAANDMVGTRQHPVMGQMRIARHYIRFGHTASVPGCPTPLLGEHTRQVLEELGFAALTIHAFYDKGVVKTETPAGER
jgi:crotonobetainyl-CoA:carnitine CoA-transferase CaiB-like acyl-CoA transferase